MRKLFALLAVVAAVQLTSTPSMAASGGDVAKGRGTTFFGDPFDFSATASFNDLGARGSARLGTAFGAIEEIASGNVTCLRVTGSLAVVGGAITDINPPNAAMAGLHSYIISATDSGKFGTGPDTLTYGFFTAPPPPDGACPTSASGLPISTGNVVIQDTIA